MKLGINTGFALNRYPKPEQWMKVIGEDLGIRHVQLTADLINPSLGDEVINDLINRIKKCKEKYNIQIDSVMTGAFTRVNHFSHPDRISREFWKKWFKKLADIAVKLGAYDLSSHFGILCYEDLYDKERRDFILKETVASWKELAEYGKSIGLKSLSWEPMSVKREYGETIEETKRIQRMLEGSAIPIYLCLDVDHGDLSSNNSHDTDYKKWLENFASISPFIHIKQSLLDKGGHYPFIEQYNIKGKINPPELIETLKRSDPMNNTILLLELSFREREPNDSLVMQHLKESAEYWQKWVRQHANE